MSLFEIKEMRELQSRSARAKGNEEQECRPNKLGHSVEDGSSEDRIQID